MFENIKTKKDRNPCDVAENIVKILRDSSSLSDQKLAEFINSSLKNWPENLVYKNLSKCVNHKLNKDPDNEISIRVYAELCGTTFEDMKTVFLVFSGKIN